MDSTPTHVVIWLDPAGKPINVTIAYGEEDARQIAEYFEGTSITMEIDYSIRGE